MDFFLICWGGEGLIAIQITLVNDAIKSERMVSLPADGIRKLASEQHDARAGQARECQTRIESAGSAAREGKDIVIT